MKIFTIIICTLFIVSCGSEKKEQEISNYILRGDTILVDEESIIMTKLKTSVVEEELYRSEFISAGSVKTIPNYYAEIAPSFSGRVTKVYLSLGMKVQPGMRLFEMISSEFLEAQKMFFQSKSEWKSSGIALKRQQDLKQNGVGSQRDLEEAETNFEIQENEYQNAIANLKIYGVNINKLVLGQPLTITSPIAGEVIKNDIVLGHYIKADDEPHAKIALLNKVWVVGEIKEKDIPFIHELDGAEIQVAAYPDRTITGKIYHIENVVDEKTRSVKVLVECDNSDRTLKPGMYVTVKFICALKNMLFVPAKAILQYNDKSFVFIELENGKYMRRYIETGITDKDRVAIVSGLQPNETIISEGAFYLLEAK